MQSATEGMHQQQWTDGLSVANEVCAGHFKGNKSTCHSEVGTAVTVMPHVQGLGIRTVQQATSMSVWAGKGMIANLPWHLILDASCLMWPFMSKI